MNKSIDIEKILTQSPLGVVVAKPAKGIAVQGKEQRRVGTVYLVEGQKAVVVPLTRGLHALVDLEDAERILQYNWVATPGKSRGPGTSGMTWYGRRDRRKEVICIHQEVVNHKFKADHINRNGLDNRRCNLRPSSPSQNATNREQPKPTVSGFRGVYPISRYGIRKYWHVYIIHFGKRISAGLFHDATEAARARDVLAMKFQGEFAVLNFPPVPAAAATP